MLNKLVLFAAGTPIARQRGSRGSGFRFPKAKPDIRLFGEAPCSRAYSVSGAKLTSCRLQTSTVKNTSFRRQASKVELQASGLKLETCELQKLHRFAGIPSELHFRTPSAISCIIILNILSVSNPADFVILSPRPHDDCPPAFRPEMAQVWGVQVWTKGPQSTRTSRGCRK